MQTLASQLSFSFDQSMIVDENSHANYFFSTLILAPNFWKTVFFLLFLFDKSERRLASMISFSNLEFTVEGKDYTPVDLVKVC